MRVVLISCASKKRKARSKAKDLYISSLFKLNLKYAESLNPDKIFVLSAKHGLLDLEEEINPYDKTLNKMPAKELLEWSAKVLAKLSRICNIERDEVIFLAGEKYRKFLVPHLPNYDVPLRGMGIGRQLKYLKGRTNYERRMQCSP